MSSFSTIDHVQALAQHVWALLIRFTLYPCQVSSSTEKAACWAEGRVGLWWMLLILIRNLARIWWNIAII